MSVTPSEFEGVTLVDHPLVQHKLTWMRQKDTPSPQFRLLLKEIALLLDSLPALLDGHRPAAGPKARPAVAR